MTGFEAWIRRRTAETGSSAEELLERDVRRAARSPYPGPDCLPPNDFGLPRNALSAADRAHIDGCPMCAALWSASHPEG